MTREQALSTAKQFGLDAEIREMMDIFHYSPVEALREWDLL